MSEQTAASDKKRSHVSYHSSFFAALFLQLALASTGIYFLPSIVETQVKGLVAEKFNRNPSIQKPDIDRFHLTVRLAGMRLTDPDSKETFVLFGHVYVQLSPKTVRF